MKVIFTEVSWGRIAVEARDVVVVMPHEGDAGKTRILVGTTNVPHTAYVLIEDFTDVVNTLNQHDESIRRSVRDIAAALERIGKFT